ncbi:MAG: ABC transporter ATP-binding protein [Bacteroidetes bacterium]|nr:ABC transporter ATP-binding protein [Bacteroidota bacterium]
MTKIKTGIAFDWQLMRRVYGMASPYKKQVWWAVLLTVMMAVLGSLRPLLVQYVIDHKISGKDEVGLLWLTILLVGMLFLQTFFQFYQGYITQVLGQNVVRDLRKKIYSFILKAKLSYFDKTPVGTIVTRTVNDIETIADNFSEGLITISGDILQIVLILFFMFYQSWEMSLVSLSVLPLLLIAANLFKNKVKASFHAVRNAVSKLNAFVQEHIQGMQIVQIFGVEKQEFEKFSTINKEHTKANIDGIMAYSLFFPVVEIITALSVALIIWFGLHGVLAQNGITPGMITAFIMYINMFYRPIRVIADRFNTMQMGMVASERVFKLMDDTSVLETDHGTMVTPILGNIKFNAVSFGYLPLQNVLHKISLEVPAGKTTAIIGATGSGKTTIINLLNRFYEYHDGEISIDGIPIKDYTLTHLRGNIGMVLQDGFLFRGTIAENISLYDDTISMQKIKDAAQAIGAHDFIEKLPGGYHYNVMERGATLSTGQRQLISFARVLAQNPNILILDEATSSIDSANEEIIQNAIKILLKTRTSIVIAHRLSTIQNADEIVVLDHGEIVERGTHENLLNQKGAYKLLYDVQFQEV